MKKSIRCVSFLLMLLFLLSLSSLALAEISGDGVLDGHDLSAVLESSLSWQDKLGLILTNPVIATVLLVLGIVGVVLEIATVGSFGVFGVVGGLSFVLYFLGSFWYGSFSSLTVWLLALGVLLLIVELFVIPGFGVCGGLGILSVLASFVLAAPNPAAAVWSLLIALALSIAIICFSLKNKKTRKLWSRLVLAQKLDEESGFASADLSLTRFQGHCGRSLTTLRPSGSALIDDEKVDVVTQGEYIEADRPVQVILVEGVRVVVREMSDEPKA